MARPRSFDTDSVLTSAMMLFWQQGYEATSIRDLERASGLTAPSLYGAFGNKEALFTAALQRYVDTVIVPAIEASTALGLSGIRTMFNSIADKDPALPRGCLLAVTSCEAGELSGLPLEVLEVGLGHLRTALHNGLAFGIATGLLDPTIDPSATADALVALHQGIQILYRSSPDHIDVRAIAGPVLDRLLPPPPDPEAKAPAQSRM
jgi:AcrR family transcriptional regulator